MNNDKIKDLAKKLGIKRKDLAPILEVSENTIYLWSSKGLKVKDLDEKYIARLSKYIQNDNNEVDLSELSLDDLLKEIKSRGFNITLSSVD